MINFNRPYLAQSISEFWKRWHISLSSWFRDYLYISLGGNRVTTWRKYYNLFITFFISGLWHGANWTFIIWGALHGIYIIFERLFEKQKLQIKKMIGIDKFPIFDRIQSTVFTFVLVAFAWIFFRAVNVEQAFKIIYKIGQFNFHSSLAMICAYLGPFNLMLCFFAILLLFISYRLPQKLELKQNLLFILTMTILVLLLGKGEDSEFIYFQF